ncbi:MAG: TrkH family potassium uptake protein [Oscillospiraceae bacterium]|nr:TrkH family potassium uptake protein [Oscillospiraceae bacterium]
MNLKMVSYILGLLLMFQAVFMAIPAVTALCYGEQELWIFLGIALICLLIGRLMTWRKPKNKTLFAREGFVIVALSWIVLSLIGAMPFFLSREIPNYIDALFESVSGFTTTGASILTEVESLPRSIIMWRSFTHWIGGMGVLVFIMAFLPLSGAQNMHIMKAESPGPSVGKLVPRVKTTALLLYAIYFALTVMQWILLLCGGMSLFDSLNTAFATAGTGGFGIRNDSLNGYSAYVQIVVTVFMLLFSINFNSYYFLLRGKLKEAFTTEVKAFLLIVGTVITIVTINIHAIFGSVGEALRHAAFTIASLISTTGFATVDFNTWPELSRALLVLVMFVGACAGSTGGGIKVSRILILCKSVTKELRNMLHPKQVKRITMDSHAVDHDVVRSVNVYMICYAVIFIGSFLVLSLENNDLVTTFTAVTATLNNIGPGLEMVGPTANYAFFSMPSKFVLIFDMLAGRLELFPMLLIFLPNTWKK